MDSLSGLGDSLDSSRAQAGPSKRNERKLNHDFKGECRRDAPGAPKT